jgi:hypothetical protein
VRRAIAPAALETHYERAPLRRKSQCRRRWAPKDDQTVGTIAWGSAPDPGIFQGMAPVSDGLKKRRPLASIAVRGPMHHRRTVGLAIPCQVASPQSLTPFHQTGASLARIKFRGAVFGAPPQRPGRS